MTTKLIAIKDKASKPNRNQTGLSSVASRGALDPDPDPAGSKMSRSGLDPDPAGSENCGSGAPLFASCDV